MASLKRQGLIHFGYLVGSWYAIRTSCGLQWTDKRRHMLDTRHVPLTCFACIVMQPYDAFALMAGS